MAGEDELWLWTRVVDEVDPFYAMLCGGVVRGEAALQCDVTPLDPSHARHVIGHVGTRSTNQAQQNCAVGGKQKRDVTFLSIYYDSMSLSRQKHHKMNRSMN